MDNVRVPLCACGAKLTLWAVEQGIDKCAKCYVAQDQGLSTPAEIIASLTRQVERLTLQLKASQQEAANLRAKLALKAQPRSLRADHLDAFFSGLGVDGNLAFNEVQCAIEDGADLAQCLAQLWQEAKLSHPAKPSIIT